MGENALGQKGSGGPTRRERGKKVEEDDGGLSSACHCSQARQKAVCIIMGCHLISQERGKEVAVFVRARRQGWEVIGARSLAQIAFYRLSRSAPLSSSLRIVSLFSFFLVRFSRARRVPGARSDLFETSSSVVALRRRAYRDRQIAVVEVIKSGNVRFKHRR